MIKQVLVENFSNFTNRMVCSFLSAYGWVGNYSQMQGLHITSNRVMIGSLIRFRSAQLKIELPCEFRFSKEMYRTGEKEWNLPLRNASRQLKSKRSCGYKNVKTRRVVQN